MGRCCSTVPANFGHNEVVGFDRNVCGYSSNMDGHSLYVGLLLGAEPLGSLAAIAAIFRRVVK
jgi:hypothetical protein